MRSSILARIPGFRQRIIPEPSFPSQGSQARGTRLNRSWLGWIIYIFQYITRFKVRLHTTINRADSALIK
jgi:hypothetical protein